MYFFHLIEQHCKFLLHTLQVLYICATFVILQTSTRYSSSFRMSAVMVSMAVLIRTFSSGIHTHPFSWNCAKHLRMELSDGGCFPNLVRNCRWTFVPQQSFWIILCTVTLMRSCNVYIFSVFVKNLLPLHSKTALLWRFNDAGTKKNQVPTLSARF